MERIPRIYCAGPLFTRKEQEEMLEIASALEEVGFETFVPQRDGLELTRCVDRLIEKGYPEEEAGQLMSRAIFALDVYQVLHGCDALVANLNGRVPDEGTVSEVAIAWSRGKPVVGYKADSRTLFGGQDNPLVTGLFEFNICTSIADAVQAVQVGLQSNGTSSLLTSREAELNAYIDLGNDLTEALNGQRSLEEVVNVILRFIPGVAAG